MKTILSLFLSLLFLPTIYGHTCSKEVAKCPIDKEKVEFCVTMSMTTWGGFLDFEKQGALGSHYRELINTCPVCHYSGYRSDFDTSFSKERRLEIKSFLSQYDSLSIGEAQQCLIAGDLKLFLQEPHKKAANCYLIGSYLLRYDRAQNNLRLRFQTKSKNNFIRAIEQLEYEDSSSIATIHYLIGELCRRTASFEEAVLYFEKALTNPHQADWLQEVAIKQKELAIEEDANNLI